MQRLNLLAITVALPLTVAEDLTAQTPPSAWKRSLEWVDQPTSSAGTSVGNPAPDSSGFLVWHHDRTAGGPIGSSQPWYEQPLVPLTWDASWFGGNGVWSHSDNYGAVINPRHVTHLLQGGSINYYPSIPVMRWVNVTGQAFDISISGSLQIIWSGVTNAIVPVDVDVVIAHRDAQSGTVTPLFTRTLAKPTNNGSMESIEFDLDLPAVAIDQGDELLFTHRARNSTNRSSWIYLRDDVCLVRLPVGTRYCGPGVGNSTGFPARMAASGSRRVLDGDLTVKAMMLPYHSSGFFLTSRTQGFVANPAGSSGNLCLAGAIGRFVGAGQIQDSGTSRSVALALDLSQQPTPNGLVQVLPGESWSFQYWYRDVGGTSNFSDGLEIVFL